MCLDTTYFAEIEKLLLKVLYIKVQVSWNSKVWSMNSAKRYSETMQLLCPGNDNGLNCHEFPQTAPTDEAEYLISEKHDPCTQKVTYTKEENKNTLQKAPVWSRPNTFRMSS